METNFQGRKFSLPPSDPTLVQGRKFSLPPSDPTLVMQVTAVPVQDPFWGLKLEPPPSVISCAYGSDENNSEASRAFIGGGSTTVTGRAVFFLSSLLGNLLDPQQDLE